MQVRDAVLMGDFSKVRTVLFILVLFLIAPIATASESHLLIKEFYANTLIRNDLDEYIVIHNPNDRPVDISGWTLSDQEVNMSFPEGTIIDEDELIYLTRDVLAFEQNTDEKADFQYGSGDDSTTPRMQGGMVRLRNDGDEIMLFDSNGDLIDLVIYGDIRYDGEGWSGVGLGRASEGGVFKRIDLSDTDTCSDWTELKYGELPRSDFPVETFQFEGDVTLFVSPDCSYKEVSEAIDRAELSIDICVYEFNNQEIMEVIKRAIGRGVDVRILMEGSPVGGMDDEELYIASEIEKAGGKVSFMQGSDGAIERYRYLHAKYMVIDNKSTLIISENFKYTGIPISGSPGNRGWGILINDTNVSSYFSLLFETDYNGRDIVPAEEFNGMVQEKKIQDEWHDPIFGSKVVQGYFTVVPVVAPDTATKNETILGLLNSAKESVYIEQLYVSKNWGEEPNWYLEAAIDAARRGCEVKILMDGSWYNVASNSETESYISKIAEEERLDIEVRLRRDDSYISKIHTKGMIVDGEKTLISSINWNKGSPVNNREAGVIVINRDVGEYFSEVFFYDWDLRREEKPILIGLAIVIIILGTGLYAIIRIKR
ncbi:MAG: phospholipase D-like domain-containing protein [Halobacteriota archaeon]|nr:phospholipase D-like domain-containing protein [Halobacteriota archaeon]